MARSLIGAVCGAGRGGGTVRWLSRRDCEGAMNTKREAVYESVPT